MRSTEWHSFNFSFRRIFVSVKIMAGYFKSSRSKVKVTGQAVASSLDKFVVIAPPIVVADSLTRPRDQRARKQYPSALHAQRTRLASKR